MADKFADYIAIVLASGRGSRMPILTEHIPKLLLPMANLPLYWFPLNMLQRTGIKDCILVVPNGFEEKIRHELNQGVVPQLNPLNVQIVSIENENNGEELGTADVIRYLLIKNKLKGKEKILVVSGDIISDLSLENMLKFHEERNSTFTFLFSDSAVSGPVPGSKERPKKYRDLVVFSPETSQLLYLMDEDDYGEEENFPQISLFKSSSNLLFTAKYKDVHIYVTNKEILAKSLTRNQSLYSSLKADFIPHLLKCQYSKSKKKLLGIEGQVNCFAYFCPKMEYSLLAQCNNIGSYLEANKAIQKIISKFNLNLVPRKFEKATGVNCFESWISENAEFGGKCQLKRSIMGSNCKIGQNVKIDNSLLMYGIIIKDGTTIKNSIILQNAQICEKVDLQMCVVAPGQKVQQGMKLSSSTIIEEKEMELSK